MKKCIFMVMAAMMMAACTNQRADEMAKVTESSRMTECNISVGGIHFTIVKKKWFANYINGT